MKNARYVETLKNADVFTVAEKLGLEVIEGRGTSPGSFACPVCNVDKRHGEGKRGACGITNDGRGWHCFACDVKGDAINLACLQLAGVRDLKECTNDQRGVIRKWCETNTGATPENERPHLRVVRPAPEYPPEEQIQGIWIECIPVDEDEEVCAWLLAKGIDPSVVATRDLARALPADHSSGWAKGGRRLIVPLRDAEGRIRNIKGRRIVDADSPKSVPLKGFSTSDLAFFDPHIEDPKLVIFCEGEKKLMQFSSHYPSAAVYGVGSGMIWDELISRVPEDVDIMLAVDPNPAGCKYANEIMKRLNSRQRVRVRLWRGFRIDVEKGGRKVVLDA